jgi:hypothetical protein
MHRFLANVLNKNLLEVRLCDYWRDNKPGSSLVELDSTCNACSLTFAGIDKKELQFPSTTSVRPYKRVLCFHAHVVNGKAPKYNLDRISFKSFWTEADEEGNKLSYIDSVKVQVEEWLERQSKQN